MKINQTISEFQLALIQRQIAKDMLGMSHINNTSRNKIAEYNKKLALNLEIEVNKNKSLTNLIKDFIKILKLYISIKKEPTDVVDYSMVEDIEDLDDNIEEPDIETNLDEEMIID